MPDGTYRTFGRDQQPPKGAVPVSTNNINLTETGRMDRFDTSTTTGLKKAYDRNVKPLTDMAETYNKAYQTIDRAAHSKDANERRLLYGAVQSQFTQSSDQAKNLRFQLLQYYTSHQSPDLGSTFSIFMNKLTKGELPKSVIEPMLSHVKALANENARQIAARRAEFLRNNQGLIDEYELPEVRTYYTYPGLYDPNFEIGPGNGSSNGGRGYSPDNPYVRR